MGQEGSIRKKGKRHLGDDTLCSRSTQCLECTYIFEGGDKWLVYWWKNANISQYHTNAHTRVFARVCASMFIYWKTRLYVKMKTWKCHYTKVTIKASLFKYLFLMYWKGWWGLVAMDLLFYKRLLSLSLSVLPIGFKFFCVW